ncbi:uncharacterized protein MP3633_1280 [Marinomonas primoryensis]|uniref:Uncharacterized protein n=1 Tax=Marinomonas primoryensis TaxID=178399 RepID=A0A859CUG4_9GAMM|nr:uncharacterized protein MP3633_1280 [Marinomonas primoryensis]
MSGTIAGLSGCAALLTLMGVRRSVVSVNDELIENYAI